MSNQAKKVETLLLEGSPVGLRYHDLANWTGRLFVAPRASFAQLIKREELNRAGVYLLIGRDEETNRLRVYIGEADILVQRLPAHVQKDFWEEIIVCIAKDESFDKASVRYIESILVEKANEDKQCDVENGNAPAVKTLSEANVAVMNEFIENMIFMFSVLGYKIIRSTYAKGTEKSPLLFCRQGSIKATGRETDEGFIVYKGSFAKKDEANSWQEYAKRLRKKLIETGVLMNSENKSLFVFSQDYVFHSPSAASGMVLARSSNGRSEWKNPNDIPLKELQA
jgi:hypothetical protein